MNILFLLNLLEIPAPRHIRAKRIGAEIRKIETLHYLSFKIANNPDVPNNSILINYSFISLGSRSFLELEKHKSKIGIYFYKIINRIFLRFSFPDVIVWEQKKLKKNLKKIIEEKKIDVVVAFVMPYGLLEVGEYVKELGCKWIVDIGDPISNNVAKKNDGKEFKRLNYEKKHLGIADAIITTNDETTDYYRKMFSENKNQIIESVYAGIPEEFLNIEKKELSEKTVKMIYAGIFYTDGVRDPSNLIEVIENNEFSGKEIVLSVYGCHLDKFSNYKNVNFKREKIPQKELFEKYKESDLLLFVDNKSSIQVPSKLFELLALKRPVVFIYYDKNSPSVKIAENYSHVFLSQNKKEEIIGTISKCLENYKNIKFDYPSEENTWNKRAEKFIKIIQGKNSK